MTLTEISYHRIPKMPRIDSHQRAKKVEHKRAKSDDQASQYSFYFVKRGRNRYSLAKKEHQKELRNDRKRKEELGWHEEISDELLDDGSEQTEELQDD
jgi:hypothetical protein